MSNKPIVNTASFRLAYICLVAIAAFPHSTVASAAPFQVVLKQEAPTESSTSTEAAKKPKKLTKSEIATVTRNGDRLADQGDFLGALKLYTQAYMGVVNNIRGQEFSLPVVPSIFTREELGEEMLKMMKEEYTDEEIHLMDCSFKVLGLAPPELDAKNLMTSLLTEEVAGFYDPDNKRMVLIVEKGSNEDPGWFGRLLGAKPAFDKDEQKTTLAHELTHALQDQLYDLNAMEEGIEDDDDMLLAFSALVEGDATLLMFVEGDPNQDIHSMDADAMRTTFNMMSWMMPLAGGETYRKAPPIFRDSLTFPYFQGMLFAIAVAGGEGWPAVHKAYQNPPLSTEQILHPSKYTDATSVDLPQRVITPDLDETVGAGWQHLGSNCLGELQTTIMLKSIKNGKKAALGWDGDRYDVFENEAGELAMTFASVWDSEEDAVEFADAYAAFREEDPHATAGVFGSDAIRQMRVAGNRVFIVEGFEKATAEALLTKLAESKFEEKSFPKPAQAAPVSE